MVFLLNAQPLECSNCALATSAVTCWPTTQGSLQHWRFPPDKPHISKQKKQWLGMFSLHLFKVVTSKSYLYIGVLQPLKLLKKIVPPQSQCITRGVFPNLFCKKIMQSNPQLINHLGLCRFQMYLMEIIVPIVLHDCGLSSHQFPWHKNEKSLPGSMCLILSEKIQWFDDIFGYFWNKDIFFERTMCFEKQCCLKTKHVFKSKMHGLW